MLQRQDFICGCLLATDAGDRPFAIADMVMDYACRYFLPVGRGLDGCHTSSI
jgi:hypothetical protein